MSEATLYIRSVRVIGDAGDDATTQERLRLKWSATSTPAAILFDQAPAGKYAKIDVIIRGSDNEDDSYELSGVVRLAGVDYRYEIEDKAQISVSIPLPTSAVLAPGGALAVGVRVNLGDLVKDVDFASIPPDRGMIKIDEDHAAALAVVRTALQTALRVDGQ